MPWWNIVPSPLPDRYTSVRSIRRAQKATDSANFHFLVLVGFLLVVIMATPHLDTAVTSTLVTSSLARMTNFLVSTQGKSATVDREDRH